MKRLRAIVIIITIFAFGLFSNNSFVYAEEHMGKLVAEGVDVEGDTGEGKSIGDSGAGTQNKNRIKGINGETGYCLDPGYTPVAKGATKNGCNVYDITNEAFGQGLAQIFSDETLDDADIANYTRGLGFKFDVAKGDAVDGDYLDDYLKLANSDYIDGVSEKAVKGGLGKITSTLIPNADGGAMKILFNNTTGQPGKFSLSNLKGIMNDGLQLDNIIPVGQSVFSLLGGGLTDASGNCIPSSFNGNVSSPVGDSGGGNECEQVLLYECGSSDDQRFASCGKMSPVSSTPDGGTEQPINGGDPVEIECPPDDKCPYPPETFVQELDGPGGIPGVADMLCDMGGFTKYINQESTVVTQNIVDRCANEPENEMKDYYGESEGYCNLYCIEDYTFNTERKPLSIDPDYEPITAGGYFNFNPQDIVIKDKVSASCYTVGHIDKAMSDILKKAQFNRSNCEGAPLNGNDYCKKDCHVTSYPVCDDSECKTSHTEWVKTVTITYWNASDNNPDFALEWQKIPNAPYPEASEGPSRTPLTCNPEDFAEYGANKPEPDYNRIAADADQIITKFNKYCTDIFNHVQDQMDDCPKSLLFSYYDGEMLLIKEDFRKFKVEQTGSKQNPEKQDVYCPQGNAYNNGAGTTKITHDKCNEAAKRTKVKIGPSKETSQILVATTTSSGYGEKEYTYTLQPPTISSDYKDEERIIVAHDASAKGQNNYYGWPISYDTPQGEYRYYFELTEVESCLKNDQDFGLTTDKQKSDDISCVYNVNGCEGCSWWCDPPSRGSCTGVQKCVGCMYSCVGAGCIYDQRGGLALNYIPISLLNIETTFDNLAFLQEKFNGVVALSSQREKLNNMIASLNNDEIAALSSGDGIPDNISYSRNWNTDKGIAIFKSINNVGEGIYDETDSANYGLEYRYVLDPKTMQNIQKYNDSKKGYLDTEMTCTPGNYGGTIAESYDDSHQKQYIICRSGFLDQLDGWSKNTRNVRAPQYKSASEVGINNIPKGTNKEVGPAWK